MIVDLRMPSSEDKGERNFVGEPDSLFADVRKTELWHWASTDCLQMSLNEAIFIGELPIARVLDLERASLDGEKGSRDAEKMVRGWACCLLQETYLAKCPILGRFLRSGSLQRVWSCQH